MQYIVKSFWWISDYGISTKRIIACFFGLALFFAALYLVLGLLLPPGLVKNLFVDEMNPSFSLRVLIRSVYFSVVTMTTLGFGDMYAHPDSICGHTLLTIQVLLGYFLLGALVSRLAIMFTSAGPAGKFDKKYKKK